VKKGREGIGAPVFSRLFKVGAIVIMTAAYEIIPATWQDLGALRKVENECFDEDAWPLWDLVGVLTLPGIVRLKAMVGEVMAGFIAGDVRPAEKLGWITTVGVRPAYRRQGIGEALLLACEEKMAMPRVRLTVRRSNTGAIQLYEKNGYHQVSVWANYYAGGEDGLILEKLRI
jgi:ribosomal protein S18 acetylase RimI-like enzyme